MTIIVTADWHLTDNPRDSYRHEFQSRLLSIIRKRKAELLILLGDITEEKDRHAAWLVNAVVDHMARLARICPVIVVKGNHDYVDASCPYYGFLRRINGISWIGNPVTVNGGPLARLGRVLLLPHSPNPKRDWADLDLKSYDWVFTHMTFQGAHGGGGHLLKGLPLDTFGKAVVLSGDIHVPQRIGDSKVFYVGAPYTVDFGDDYEAQIIAIKDKEMVGVTMPGPQKRLVEVNTLTALNKAKQNISPGDVLKVRYVLKPEEKDSWQTIRESIRRWGDKNGFYVHVVQPVMLHEFSLKKPAGKAAKLSDTQLLRQYGQLHKIDKAKMKVGLNIVRKA